MGSQLSEFTLHNEMVARLWRDFKAGRPTRVPAIFGIGTRYFLQTPELNQKRYTFRQYFEDPAVQWEVQLSFQRWVRENVPQDMERGRPAEWRGLAPDFQNVYEAYWLGCPIEFREGEVPDTRPILQEDKSKFAGMSLPDPEKDGLQGRAMEFFQYFEERRKQEDFAGRPVGKSQFCAVGSDGPFTVACNLRGATEMCLDLYEDPQFARELLDFITEAILLRVKTVMKHNQTDYPKPGWGIADDCIQLLSGKTYREFILPYHQRIYSTFSSGDSFMHICGKVQHLLPVLNKELGIQGFELGFPVNLAEARRTLGPAVLLMGNLHPQTLRDGPIAKIQQETAEIITSEAKLGRYIFCDGNNVAPGTPVAHLAAAYETAVARGSYEVK